MTTGQQNNSHQGQRGAPIQLGFEDLNEKEQSLLTLLNGEGHGRREVYTLWEAVYGLGWEKVRGGKTRGNSWVRNCLRRLVRARFVEHASEVGDGTYRITKSGRNAVNQHYGWTSAVPAKPKRTRRARPRKREGGKKAS